MVIACKIRFGSTDVVLLKIGEHMIFCHDYESSTLKMYNEWFVVVGVGVIAYANRYRHRKAYIL